MTESHTVISVRGDAQLEVPPDVATMHGRITTVESSKKAALLAVTDRLEAILSSLRELGGTTMAAGDDRRPLTWLTRSATSHPRVRFDKERQRRVRTGKIVAEVGVVIQLRDFALTDRVAVALASHEGYHGAQVGWSVDHDNAAWRRVRADAIAAAIRKAHDYADALHGTLVSLDHLADVGLLGAAEERSAHTFGVSAARLLRGTARKRVPSLDPEPQVLSATVEARFSASVADLGESVP